MDRCHELRFDLGMKARQRREHETIPRIVDTHQEVRRDRLRKGIALARGESCRGDRGDFRDGSRVSQDTI